MSANESENERFLVLETKVAYQDNTIAELNEVVVDQSRAITALTQRVQLLESQLNSLASGGDAPNEKPPHY